MLRRSGLAIPAARRPAGVSAATRRTAARAAAGSRSVPGAAERTQRQVGGRPVGQAHGHLGGIAEADAVAGPDERMKRVGAQARQQRGQVPAQRVRQAAAGDLLLEHRPQPGQGLGLSEIRLPAGRGDGGPARGERPDATEPPLAHAADPIRRSAQRGERQQGHRQVVRIGRAGMTLAVARQQRRQHGSLRVDRCGRAGQRRPARQHNGLTEKLTPRAHGLPPGWSGRSARLDVMANLRPRPPRGDEAAGRWCRRARRPVAARGGPGGRRAGRVARG